MAPAPSTEVPPWLTVEVGIGYLPQRVLVVRALDGRILVDLCRDCTRHLSSPPPYSHVPADDTTHAGFSNTRPHLAACFRSRHLPSRSRAPPTASASSLFNAAASTSSRHAPALPLCPCSSVYPGRPLGDLIQYLRTLSILLPPLHHLHLLARIRLEDLQADFIPGPPTSVCTSELCPFPFPSPVPSGHPRHAT